MVEDYFSLDDPFPDVEGIFLGFVKQSGATWRMRLRPLATVGWAILSVLLVLEGIFMFVAKSSINDTTLASKIWFARHWQLTEDGFGNCRIEQT
ncbi:MAG: hypothetical protein IPP17_19150 [Bacteroidetes bacterium]|nr:hypothetical protein [Bacteroidota bacterium]